MAVRVDRMQLGGGEMLSDTRTIRASGTTRAPGHRHAE